MDDPTPSPSHNGTARRGTQPPLPVHGLPTPSETAQFMHAILDGTTDAIFIKDQDGRYVLINAAGARLIGLPPEAIIGKCDTEVFPAPTAREIMAHDRHVLQGGRRQSFEVVIPVDGRPRTFLSTKTPYRDATGRVIGLIGISRDISERKAAMVALRESEERLARVLESALDAIVTIDERWNVRLFNNAAEEVFRCRACDMLNQSFERLTSRPLREVLRRCRRAFEQNRVRKPYVWIPGGLTARRADGEEFPIEATISLVEAAGEQLLTIILRDVNERRHAEEQLRRLKLQNLYLHEEVKTSLGIGELVGESPAMQRVFRQIEQVAATDATVLLLGETGTGKELIARAIHRRSARHAAMLVAVNCAALPGGLIESELFGHERGAFTGAAERRVGRFELADGGTLFLDEIGDLAPELQAKLLRVLQEGEFERVGGTDTLRADVRFIAATNQDLEAAVAGQRFRADLYYRLNVFPIRVPPLRERLEDIPALARHFAFGLSKRMGRRIESIPADVLGTLQRYHWPGNIRELRNVIERAVIISTGPRLELAEWPPEAGHDAIQGEVDTLDAHERKHILRALEQTGWRVSGERGAARLLGMKPTTLESRMKRLGLVRPG